MVNKLRAALDANSTLQSPSKVRNEIKKNAQITVESTGREFEGFLRSLSRCPNLLEAKRLRNDIEINFRRAGLPGGKL